MKKDEVQGLKNDITFLKNKLLLMEKRKRMKLYIGIVGLCIIPLTIWAAAVTKPYTFSAGAKASSSQVNENFDTLYTKVNELDAFIPVGTIIGWHKSLTGVSQSLPSGWVECNGQTLSDGESDLNGQVIPNLNGSSSGADSPGQTGKEKMFLRGGTASGTGESDAFQGHWHQTIRSLASYMG